MPKSARFKVHPRLAELLGGNYRSSEHALKELVDNAWDADADEVRIALPDLMRSDPIVIEDDGTGMTEREVREEYLHVANSRHSRKGALTVGKRRPVKGRKGIGKFAGLLAADTMLVETMANGRCTRLRITKANLLDAGNSDIERIDLPIEVVACEPSERGTRITLTGLAQNLLHPSPDRLRRILVLEYDRKESFRVFVNDEEIAIEDIPGESARAAAELDAVGHVGLAFTVTEKPVKQPGIAIRIGGKIVGKPSLLGLEDDETIPPKLLKRVYGEIEADGLADDVTADWGAIFENSTGFARVKAWAGEQLRQQIVATFKNEVELQKARLRKEAKRRLDALPENRRSAAEAAIHRVLEKLYAESEERVHVVVSLMLDAFEKDEYWAVFKSLDEATRADVVRLADVLDQFGIVDLAVVAHQARRRLDILDEFDRLIASKATLESQVHTAIERNLWMLGCESSHVLTSNSTLAGLIERWAQTKYKGHRASKRPDLFLARASKTDFLLVEFKRPSHTITRQDEAQAATYRDEIAPYVGGKAIDVIVIGGDRDGVATAYETTRLRVTTYADLVSLARDELTWLVSELIGTRE